MAQVLVGGLTDEQKRQLQIMAGTIAARDARRLSLSGLAREIITEWLDENCKSPEESGPIQIPQEYLDRRRV